MFRGFVYTGRGGLETMVKKAPPVMTRWQSDFEDLVSRVGLLEGMGLFTGSEQSQSGEKRRARQVWFRNHSVVSFVPITVRRRARRRKSNISGDKVVYDEIQDAVARQLEHRANVPASTRQPSRILSVSARAGAHRAGHDHAICDSGDCLKT